MDTVYDKEYYDTQLGDIPCYPGEPTWEKHFEELSDEIAILRPRSVIEFGCSFGMLVYYLREKHRIDAVGYDISEYAIANAKSEHCHLGDVICPPNEAFSRRWDMAVCIEVLEHLWPKEAKRSIANLCRLAPVVLFSSDPDDTETESHKTVLSIHEWDGLFSRHRFRPVPTALVKKVSPQARLYVRT